jgi:DNA-binding Lrp family transcriptional regulator
MINTLDLELIIALQNGLPLVSRPYAQIAEQLQLTESDVIQRLQALKQQGLIKRLGVIVNHRKLGYQANAMVVFNIPDADVTRIGNKISQFDFINLCYRRPRHEELWPFNLFCMIHGKTRETVLQQLENLIQTCELTPYAYNILFSQRCFKQRGAVYKQQKE